MILIIVLLYALGGVLMYCVCCFGEIIKPENPFSSGAKACAVIAWPICAIYLIRGLS